MSQARRQKIILTVLAAVFAVILWKNFAPQGRSVSSSTTLDGPSSSQSRSSRRRGRGSRGGQPKAEATEARILHLEALEPQAASFETGRNLWDFYVPPPPPPPPPPVRQVQPRQQQRRTAPVDTGPPPVRVPTISFEYLGSFGPKRRRIAVFSDRNGILNALEGTVIDSKFRVAKIGFESVYIEYVDFPEVEAKQLKAGG
ncbi:MAG: hypothetical protein K0U98_09765 [Deltaproteobacteria bacterium]|nr:hypothetical protein [Deltaproteobacteria bacterium]